MHIRKLVPPPFAPSGRAERSEEGGESGGKSIGETTSHTPNPAKASPNLKAKDLPIDQVTSAPVGEGNQGASSAVTSAAALTPAQAEKQQRQAAAYLEKMTRWLTLDDPILLKEAQTWFAARSERARSQLGVEETDPGG